MSDVDVARLIGKVVGISVIVTGGLVIVEVREPSREEMSIMIVLVETTG